MRSNRRMADSEPANLSMQIQQLMHALLKSYERCEELCLAQQGVTVSQAYALLALPHDGEVTMNDLSEKMGLANSTMTRMVDQLVQKNMAHRHHDEEDRRVVWVGLAAPGRQVQRTLERAQREFFQCTLKEIGEDECVNILHALEKANNLLARGFENCMAGNSDS